MALNVRTEWDLTPLLNGDDDSGQVEDLRKAEEAVMSFVKRWASKSDFLNDSMVLKKALDEYEELNREHGFSGNIGYYLWLRTAKDQNDPKLKSKLNKVEEIAKRLENEVQFFELKLGKISRDKQEEFLKSEDLKDYRHFLERLFESSRHMLSNGEERIMNLKSTSSYGNWVRMVSGFLSKEEREILLEDGTKAKKSFEEILKLTVSKDEAVRDFAVKEFNDILLKNSDVAEMEINSILADKKINDELRGFERPDSARHMADDIDTEVVDSLIKAVSRRFDISRNYYDLKAKLFGVKKLKYNERNVPYGDFVDEFDYEKSVNLVYKVLNGLDEEFGEIFKKFVERGQIDAFPKKGKRGGAFCGHELVSQPIYVLLNHTNKIRDVTTIAHEMGHAINFEYMRKQNALNFGTTLSTAEVASTFMEDFVFDELLSDVDNETKLSLLVQKLDEEISTIIRQIACYKFEQELHSEFRKKGYLSKEEIGDIFSKHMAAYMGDSVEQSEGSENWWVYWSHIRVFFYVYSYASGLLISKSLQKMVKEDKSFLQKVKWFFSAGKSMPPKDIFLELGVDITKNDFWENGLREVEDLLISVEELAKRLGKLK